MLTIREAAAALKVSRNTILRMISRRDLPNAFKLSEGKGRREWRIPQADIDAIKNRNKPDH